MSTGDPAKDEALQKAVRLVLAMLPQDGDVTPGEITDACVAVHGMLVARGGELDRRELQNEVETLVMIWQEAPTGLEDRKGHVEWLADAKAERSWEFWDRYRRYLEDVRLMPRKVVGRLEEATDRVLRKLEDPRRPGGWDRQGLVVGEVQSGKTGNYIGLMCKAADAGYKLIVVLAGIHNSLRSQTQLRVDEGLLGFDTQYQQRYDEDRSGSQIGAGAMPGAKRLKIASLTTSAESGDFKRSVAKNLALPIGDYPVVLVIKKHRRILDYVRKWVTEVEGVPVGDDDRRIVRDIPLLIIDDEADNASVNVAADPDADPSAINKALRALTAAFEKWAYVGYTATPFANIYIDPDNVHDRYGLDFFPRSFIESLSAPSNYLGPTRVFGLPAREQGEEDTRPMPVFRPVQDYGTWMPDGHEKTWVPPQDLPASLREALYGFILTCAARRARGQAGEHNSMLVHVTRFQDVQNRVKDQFQEELTFLADRIRYGDANSSRPVGQELRELWERDFVPTTAWFPAGEVPSTSWDQVRGEIMPAILKIQVRAINGSSRDALEYYENRRNGLSVIAVGGNKLSRGLTLEGLSVSYYLRATKMYDTLLQMGRWFGYRPGYEDLCRLYTTTTLRDAYTEVTAANAELRRDFEEMAALDATPEEFGLRVRASSAGLLITAQNKMRRGIKIRLSYSGDIPETVSFAVDAEALRDNFALLKRFVDRLDRLTTPGSDPSDKSKPSVVWRGVPASEIIDVFLAGYVPDPRAQRVRPEFIREYIRRCVQAGELGNWTVRLVSSSAGEAAKIGPYEVGLVTRQATNEPATEGRYRIRRVLSPADESLDLDPQQQTAALEATRKAAEGKLDKKGRPRPEPKVPTGTPLRVQRRPDQAHLMIYPLKNPLPDQGDEPTPVVGFAISFPFSEKATETEYVVNEIWHRLGFDDSDDEDVEE